MGVISVRLNREEERILKKLSDHFHTDKSTLIKKSLLELYEEIIDLKTVKTFEEQEVQGKTSFVSSEDIIPVMESETLS